MSLSGYEQGKKVQCPYEPAHQILPERFQTHLVKCRNSHQSVPKVVCPYNATHIVGECELKYHKENCPDVKVVLQDMVFDEDCNAEPIIMPVTNLQIECDENWDDVNMPTYNPEEHLVFQPIMRTLPGSKPSERKNFRLQERQRIQHVLSNSTPEKKSAEPLRTPNQLG